MKQWIDTAIEYLNKSLKPVPVELNEIDWKCGLSTKTERIAHHISAFSNQRGGGFFSYGIDDSGRSMPLSKKEMDDVILKLGNIACNNIEPKITLDHAVVDYHDSPLLLVYVPEQIHKPTHIRGSDIYSSYKRSAGRTEKLSRHEVKQLISQSLSLDFESQTALYGITDDEVLNFLDYDSYFRLQDLPLPSTKRGILQKLAEEGLIYEGVAGWDVLNQGAILFARNLEYFKELKRKQVRLIEYRNSNRLDGKEVEEKKGYATGFEGLLDHVVDMLRPNEVIESSLRKQVKLYPKIALREFIANAIIHQDFTIKGAGVMIELFPDRIEITNPGIPLVDVNRFIDTAPKSRNEALASLMRRLNICEERGSGVDRALVAIEEFQLPAPRFIRGEEYTKVILYAPQTLTRMRQDDKIRACYQHTVLHYISNQVVNNQSIRKRFKIGANNSATASKILADTIEAGFIKLSDESGASKKFASYIPYWA